MKQRPRIYYSESQKALMCERGRKGDSFQQIAQSLRPKPLIGSENPGGDGRDPLIN